MQAALNNKKAVIYMYMYVRRIPKCHCNSVSRQTSHIHLGYNVSSWYLEVHGEGPDVAEDLGAVWEEHGDSANAGMTIVYCPSVSGH